MFERFKFAFSKKIGTRTDYDKVNAYITDKSNLKENAKYLKDICNEIIETFSSFEEKILVTVSCLSDDCYGVNGIKSEIKRLQVLSSKTYDDNCAVNIQNKIISLKKRLFEFERKAISSYVTGVINGEIDDYNIYSEYKKILSLLTIVIKNNQCIFAFDTNFVEAVNIVLLNNKTCTYEELFYIVEYVKTIYNIANKIMLDSSYTISNIKNSDEFHALEVLENIYNKKR